MIFVLIFLFGCIDSFPDKSILDNPNPDFDEDGLTEVEGDCDDNDEDIQKIVWYVDGDGDGYGLESLQTESCTRPEGYTDQLEDCDDTNAAVHPEADEIYMKLMMIVMIGRMMRIILYNKTQQNTSLKTEMVMDLEMVLHNNCVLAFLVWLITKMIATMKT